jgi:glucose/arabinose dehydrogenase
LAGAALTVATCSTQRGGLTTTPPPSVSSSPPSASPRATPPAIPEVRAELVATLDHPLAMAIRAADPALYIVSKSGTVWALRSGTIDGTPALDLSREVSSDTEQGLLGMAFSSDGRFAYVDYTDRSGDTNIVEYEWKGGRADISTKRLVLFVKQPYPNHNGGNLAFGPDGYLYIGMGDGGSEEGVGDPQGDPHRNGQNLGVLLGKMLRIDPRMSDGSLPPGGPYAIPPDNPFVDRTGARPEIWAYGLRNPWRFSFDRQMGDLWIGDVGAGAWEEVDLKPARFSGGQNYGWNIMEGTAAYRTPPPDAVAPLYEYGHGSGACAVTGGYVYRGSAIAGLSGWYVFGDFCKGNIDGLQLLPGGRSVYVISSSSIPELSSFGEDQEGELYALSLSGGVFKLVP